LQVIADPFPNDPPIPEDVPAKELESTVRGPLAWLVDNPGRQQIGSFHPITEEDWTEGAYISHATEALILAAIGNDVESMEKLLASDQEEKKEEVVNGQKLLLSRDFLGRTTLHAAVMAHATEACQTVLDHLAVDDGEFLKSRMADGRTALHLAAMRGNATLVEQILVTRKALAAAVVERKALAKEDEATDDVSEDFQDHQVSEESLLTAAAVELLDIDGADWEIKMNPLQYAIAFGHVEVVRVLLANGASVRKPAIHKDLEESRSVLSILALFASECGGQDGIVNSVVRPMAELLISMGGASTAQVDTSGATCWHQLASSNKKASLECLDILLEADASRHGGKARALDILDAQSQTPLYRATAEGNAGAISSLLRAGATPIFSSEDWDARIRRAAESRDTGSHNYYHYEQGPNQQSENLRCPIFVAAQCGDGTCLAAYLAHDASLANAVITVPKQGGHRGAFSHFAARQQPPKLVPMRPLDILEMTRGEVLDNDDSNTHRLERKAQYQAEASAAERRVAKATEHRNSFNEQSYERSVWSLIIRREQQEVLRIKEEAKYYIVSEEQEKVKNDSIKQIDAACIILRRFGGEPHPRDESYTSQEKQAQVAVTPLVTTLDEDDIADPFHSHREMQSLDFEEMHMAVYGDRSYRKRASIVPISEQKNVSRLMMSVANSIPNAELRDVASHTRVCIYDSVGFTPFFLAVVKGDTSALQIVIEAAKRQFLAYVENQKLTQLREKELEGETEDAEHVVIDQIRRINNLDIEAGEKTIESGPTPDTMRRRLEASEAAALEEEARASTSGEIGTGSEVRSHVSPEALLLHRSIVLPDSASEPRVAELKKYLAKSLPYYFPDEWVHLPLRVRPIELAVIRGDIKMVKALIDIALDVTRDESIDDVGEHGDETLAQMDSGDEEEGANDEAFEHFDDDDEDEEVVMRSTRHKAVSLTRSELRFLLAGEGSRHPDLGGMTLLQLAIISDNVPIFCDVAAFAREYGLPRGAVVAWKRDVDSRDATFEEEAKQKRQKETDLIAGEAEGRYYCRWRLSLWTADSIQSDEVYPSVTPLQFGLTFRSQSICRALMSGEVDARLLDWIVESEKGTEACMTHRVSRRLDLAGPRMAAIWISKEILENSRAYEELAFRLVRPTAPDHVGRTALFYSPAALVPDVVGSAVEAGTRANVGDSASAKASFLETRTTSGSVSALMAAASAGEVDRVQALLDSGCSRSTWCGPKKWGPIHLAIPKDAPSNYNNSNNTAAKQTAEKWTKARQIIDLLVASEEDIDECLLSPQAEHTPLMLAIQRGADGEMISFLLKKMASSVTKGLSSKDGELNSVLHLAVKAVIGETRTGVKALDCIKTILARPELPKVVGPHVENSRGETPFEQALESVAALWTRSSTSNRNTRHFYQSDGSPVRRPQQDETNAALDALMARRVLLVLANACTTKSNAGGSGTRLPVGFEDAAAGAKHRLAQKDEEDMQRQNEPSGSPVVLEKHQGGMWDGWPT
jgi:ankyrin repeat protein